jgi:hypothetical protein
MATAGRGRWLARCAWSQRVDETNRTELRPSRIITRRHTNKRKGQGAQGGKKTADCLSVPGGAAPRDRVACTAVASYASRARLLLSGVESTG